MEQIQHSNECQSLSSTRSHLKKSRKIMLILPLFALTLILPYANSESVNRAAENVELKRKVAIARFTNETQSGQSFLLDDSNSDN